jgi:ketopantoate hydroxymethyltransferase
VAGEITRSFEAYIKDVKQGDFPAQEHAYQMVEGELTKLQDALK